MDLQGALDTLKIIRGEVQHQHDEAKRKNDIRKCDHHIARMQLCQIKLDAIDYILEAMDGNS